MVGFVVACPRLLTSISRIACGKFRRERAQPTTTYTAHPHPHISPNNSAEVAPYIGAEFNDTVFVDNASNGVNAIMRSLARVMPPGRKILVLNTAYFMVKMVCV